MRLWLVCRRTAHQVLWAGLRLPACCSIDSLTLLNDVSTSCAAALGFLCRVSPTGNNDRVVLRYPSGTATVVGTMLLFYKPIGDTLKSVAASTYASEVSRLFFFFSMEELGR